MAVTRSLPGLQFQVDWLPAEGVASPELAATWARLEILVGHESVTQVEDVESGAVRRSIFVPLYPLAEWIAYNWWFLRSHVRPSYLSRDFWTYRSLASSPRRIGSAWLTHHNLRGIGDGFVWPDLTIVPDGHGVRLMWHGDRNPRADGSLKFLSWGETDISSEVLRSSLAGLVDDVLIRLAEAGVRDTPLEQEWAHLALLDEDEVEFCVAAGQLGLDPHALPGTVAELIATAGQRLDQVLLQDFLTAATPDRLGMDLEWIAHVSDAIERRDDSLDDLPRISRSTASVPWRRGSEDAQRLREALRLDVGDVVALDRWVATTEVDRPDRSLEALGGWSGRGSRVLAVAGQRSASSSRFAAGRSLYRFLRGDRRHLLTTAKMPVQQAERAFAAELLAPVEGIHAMVGPDVDYLSADDVADLAARYRVSDWVVRYQILHNLELAPIGGGRVRLRGAGTVSGDYAGVYAV